jgi:hypothetical protein
VSFLASSTFNKVFLEDTDDDLSPELCLGAVININNPIFFSAPDQVITTAGTSPSHFLCPRTDSDNSSRHV